jgi:hypothetical protein
MPREERELARNRRREEISKGREGIGEEQREEWEYVSSIEKSGNR